MPMLISMAMIKIVIQHENKDAGEVSKSVMDCVRTSDHLSELRW